MRSALPWHILLLFLGATVYCLCREKGCGVQWALLVLFAAQLMLRTMAQMMPLCARGGAGGCAVRRA